MRNQVHHKWARRTVLIQVKIGTQFLYEDGRSNKIKESLEP
jgi:hypothetical protein